MLHIDIGYWNWGLEEVGFWPILARSVRTACSLCLLWFSSRMTVFFTAGMTSALLGTGMTVKSLVKSSKNVAKYLLPPRDASCMVHSRACAQAPGAEMFWTVRLKRVVRSAFMSRTPHTCCHLLPSWTAPLSRWSRWHCWVAWPRCWSPCGHISCATALLSSYLLLSWLSPCNRCCYLLNVANCSQSIHHI